MFRCASLLRQKAELQVECSPSWGARGRVLLTRCRSLFLIALLAMFLCLPDRAAAERASASVLTIGNSFADNATAYLPDLAKAGGKNLILFRANIGGASLERHAFHLAKAEANSNDPEGRPYRGRPDPKTGAARDFSLPEALSCQAWDFVTLQQVSQLSFRPETYHPYTEQLIAAVRKNAPTAEILIHQTWAYRMDHPLFRVGDGFTPRAMYLGIRYAYDQLADQTKFRILVVGDAFHLARETRRWKFTPDPSFAPVTATDGQLPDQRRSLNVGWFWGKAPGQTQPTLKLDAIHANPAGRYLGAVVFYMTIFDTSEVPASFTPQGLSEPDAAALRALAQAAVLAERANRALESRTYSPPVRSN